MDSWKIIDPDTNLPSDDYKLTNNNGIYEITMTITADMVASGNNLACTTAGTYCITFDLANKTINIYKV